LLGAKKVYATDIAPLLDPKWIRDSVLNSVDYIIWDCLARFEDYEAVRERFNKLLAIDNFSLEALKNIGVEYIAPFDLAKEPLNIKADFVFSKSVLEHVPINDVLPLLRNVVSDLSPDGKMFHLIHLEDHKDSNNEPFAFLSEPESTYSKEMQSSRGNRIRRSHWEKIFANIDELNYQFVFEWSRKSQNLPAHIDSSIQYIDEDDLKVTHIGLFGMKKKSLDRDKVLEGI
jgi:hypothetical protein